MARPFVDRVEALFDAALAEPPDQREAYVRAACEGDEVLCREVVSLLQADASAGSFLDTEAAPSIARLAPPDSSPLVEGDVVGDYEIEACIGAGGFGAVYRARHRVIGKLAALKLLHPERAASRTLQQRFVTEARAVNEIGHPNIIDIFGFGETPDGRMYYAMEYLDVPTLEHVLEEEGAMSVPRALPILRGLAAALDAAHARGIVHRDLKPANVLLQRDADGAWRPKLLDFGIAKLIDPEAKVPAATESGQLLGTPAYMAPEQIRNETIDARTDAYALGVLSFRMLTGQLPFVADSAFDVMVMHTQQAPRRPSELRPELDASADAFVLALLRKSPDERPRDLAAAVRSLASAPAASTASAASAASAASSRGRRLALVVVAVLAVLLTSAWLSTTRVPLNAQVPPLPSPPTLAEPAPSASPAAPAVSPAATQAAPAPSPPPSAAAPDPAPDDTKSAPVASTPGKSRSLNPDLETPF